MKTKTADEQIKDFEAKQRLYANLSRKSLKWYMVPAYFALIIFISSILFLPPLIVLVLLRYLGVI